MMYVKPNSACFSGGLSKWHVVRHLSEHKKKIEQKTRDQQLVQNELESLVCHVLDGAAVCVPESNSPAPLLPYMELTGLASEHTEYSLATRPKILARASALLCHQCTNAAMYIQSHTSNQARSLRSQDHAGGDYQNDVRDAKQP